MNRLTLVLALALVVALTAPAVAEVEEITVGGSIQIRGNYINPGYSSADGNELILQGFDLQGEIERGVEAFFGQFEEWPPPRNGGETKVDVPGDWEVPEFESLQDVRDYLNDLLLYLKPISEDPIAGDAIKEGMAELQDLLDDLNSPEVLMLEGETLQTGFDDKINSMDWVTQRTRVNVDAKLSGGVRGFVELQAYDYWGLDFDELDELTGSGDQEVFMYQGYIEMNDIADYPLSLRMGRQELAYGREWLVGNNSAGMNFSGLAFDAVKASYNDEMFAVDAWWSKLAENTSPATDPREEDGDVDFYGVYGSYMGLEDVVIDAYWLWVRDGSAKDTDAHNSLHTIGGRGAGALDLGEAGMLDLSGELAFQFGDNDIDDGDGDSGEYKGWAANVMAGYTFADVAYTPRLELEYAYFSGDDDVTDGDTDEFQRLFSDVHYGELNLGGTLDAGATNLHVIRVGASAMPLENLCIKGDLYWFLLAEDDEDGLGMTFGAPQIVPLLEGKSTDDSAGLELDLIADYQYTEDLNLRVGWTHFFVDDAIENSWGLGQDDDVDYLYVQALLVF